AFVAVPRQRDASILNWICHFAGRSRPLATRSAGDGDGADAHLRQHIRKPFAEVALHDDRVAFDGTTAAELLLQLGAPAVELGWREPELLDHGHFFAATLLALESDDCSRRTFRRRCRRIGLLGSRWQLVAQLLQRFGIDRHRTRAYIAGSVVEES